MEESLTAERERVEATEKMKEQVQRLIQQAEINSVEVKTFQLHKEKQEAEISRLRKELEELLQERDSLVERFGRAVEAEKKAINRIEDQQQGILKLPSSFVSLFFLSFCVLFRFRFRFRFPLSVLNKMLCVVIMRLEENEHKLQKFAFKYEAELLKAEARVKELVENVEEVSAASSSPLPPSSYP